MSTTLTWTKSSYSSEQGGACVEVATAAHTIHVRDSKDIARGALRVQPQTWQDFLTSTTS